MQALDANADHVLNAQDAAFSQLRIWADANGNGKTDAGELKSLSELGIVELDLAARSSATVDHGNLVGLISGYKTADGVTHQMGDVWFAKASDGTADAATDATGSAARAHLAAEDLLAAPSASTTALLSDAAHTAAAAAASSTTVAPGAAAGAAPEETAATVHHAAMAALQATARRLEEDGAVPLL